MFFNSRPIDPGLAGVPIEENVGSRSLLLVTDTQYEMATIVEGAPALDVEHRTVTVLNVDDPSRIRQETFEWGCFNGPERSAGWSQRIYERGQLASNAAPIRGVRNISGFPVHLMLIQDRDDESLPPLIRDADLPVSGTPTTAFNGEYYGQWIVRPAAPSPYGDVTCTGPSEPGSLFVPPDGGPVIVSEPPPIVLQVEFACTNFL